jgi:hypothetical protein
MNTVAYPIYFCFFHNLNFGEEVIYSQESPKMEESFKDFDWDLSRFVEYRSLFTRKETYYQLKKTVKI